MSQSVLIYGGKGALGSGCVTFFKKKGWRVLAVDLVANEHAESNIVLSAATSWNEQARQVLQGVSDFCGDEGKLSAILCVAGGWAGGSASSDDLVATADLMWKQSVWTSVIASQVGSKFLSPNGLLLLTGALPALGGTPAMIGYGMAKAAVHQLVKSLAEKGSGIAKTATVLAILPATLDTPNNRKFMPNADMSTWTPLDTIAQFCLDWANNKDGANPISGSLVALVTEKGETTCKVQE